MSQTFYMAGSTCFIVGSCIVFSRSHSFLDALTAGVYIFGSVFFLIGTIKTLLPPRG